MANSRISFVSNILIPILTGIITLVLFLLFRPENAGALFYTNMIYTLLLEGFLFGFLSLLQKESKNISGAFYSIISVGAIYYIIFGSGWMIAYSLLLTAILSYKVYIAYKGNYRTFVLGFPFESIQSEADRATIMAGILGFFTQR